MCVCVVFEESAKGFIFQYFPTSATSKPGFKSERFFFFLLIFPLTGGFIMHHFSFYPAHCVPLRVPSTVSDLKIMAGRRHVVHYQQERLFVCFFFVCFSVTLSCNSIGEGQKKLAACEIQKKGRKKMFSLGSLLCGCVKEF